MQIECDWKKRGCVVINPDGQVLPCCYLGNKVYRNEIKGVLDEYVEDKDKYNLTKHELKDILKGKWFTETLPKSWENYDDAHHICKRYCTINDK